jgi:DNA-binding response OmpR family regulator
MHRIAIVEDDPKLRGELAVLLRRNGYEVDATEDFAGVVEHVESVRPDLVLLDLNLPVFDGFYVCRELRRHSAVPIVIVTSRDTEIDELTGMNLGADDFVTKPFNMQILLARIASVLRRADPRRDGERLDCGRFSLNYSRSSLEHDGAEVELTRNEFRILGRLCEQRGEIVPRDELMLALWNDDVFVDDNTLTVNINRLRKTLESAGLTDLIETRRGQGYMIAE